MVMAVQAHVPRHVHFPGKFGSCFTLNELCGGGGQRAVSLERENHSLSHTPPGLSVYETDATGSALKAKPPWSVLVHVQNRRLESFRAGGRGAGRQTCVAVTSRACNTSSQSLTLPLDSR